MDDVKKPPASLEELRRCKPAEIERLAEQGALASPAAERIVRQRLEGKTRVVYRPHQGRRERERRMKKIEGSE